MFLGHTGVNEYAQTSNSSSGMNMHNAGLAEYVQQFEQLKQLEWWTLAALLLILRDYFKFKTAQPDERVRKQYRKV